jgi:hypothetical protein
VDDPLSLLWLFFILASLQPAAQRSLLMAARRRQLAKLSRDRGATVITLIHRQETMSLFIPLVTLGPLVSGLAAGANGVAARVVALVWFCGGLLMLVSDLAINGEDVAFHAVVAVFTAVLAAGAAAAGALLRRRPRPVRT